MARPRPRPLLPSLALLTGLALSAPAGELHAQSGQRWSVQASAISVLVFGDVYEGLESGIGGEAQLRLTPGALSWGGGVQASSHTLALGELGSENVRIIGVFLEPRYVMDVGRNHAPYGSARLSYLRIGADIDGVDVSSSGAQINLGGGVLFRLSPRVNLDLGATVGVVRFGDFELEYQGDSAKVPDSAGTGQNLVLRIGLAVGLGG